MATETKSYTAGAERAALELVRGVYRNFGRPIMGNADEVEARGVAELISSRTHDAEMLEALKTANRFIFDHTSFRENELWNYIEALIAKVEGR